MTLANSAVLRIAAVAAAAAAILYGLTTRARVASAMDPVGASIAAGLVGLGLLALLALLVWLHSRNPDRQARAGGSGSSSSGDGYVPVAANHDCAGSSFDGGSDGGGGGD